MLIVQKVLDNLAISHYSNNNLITDVLHNVPNNTTGPFLALDAGSGARNTGFMSQQIIFEPLDIEALNVGLIWLADT